MEAAVAGKSDMMVALERQSENGVYKCGYQLVGLGEVANIEKKVPRAWINKEGNGVTQEFIDYVKPLIQGETGMVKVDGLPRFAKLKKVRVT